MRNRLSLAVFSCVLFAMLLAAVCAVGATPARAAGGTCSISGAVTAPSVPTVSWVEVTAYDGTGAQVAQTEASGGAYALTGLPQGTYRLLFHDTQGRFRDQYYGGATTLAGAAVITLSAEQQAATADVTLEPWGAIDGYVSAQNSGSVPGAPVRLLGAAGQLVASSTCNEFGHFAFTELELGAYYLAADTGPLSLGAFYPSALSLAEATPVTLTREAPTTQTGHHRAGAQRHAARRRGAAGRLAGPLVPALRRAAHALQRRHDGRLGRALERQRPRVRAHRGRLAPGGQADPAGQGAVHDRSDP